MDMREQKGVTFIEMLVVMAILCIVTAAGTLSLNEYAQRTKLRTAGEKVASALREARWIARTSGAMCTIKFDPSEGAYAINEMTEAKLPKGISFGADSSVTGKPSQPSDPPPADGISFGTGSSKNLARYYPTGTVVPTGAVYLTNGKSTIAVTVAITGRPKLWRSGGGNKWVPI
ncbi:MAG: prepilin-type N-terminal cleavage/methylation domain-containing protein [Nitrospiraceae bacterium]|nr:prepilin-type N-terminal cleavage/methylation domain-containing protein [Nitrospiraceae bacterium]